MGTRTALAVGVAAADAGCPVAELAEEGAAATDVAVVEADPAADELEFCEWHPVMRTPTTTRAAPVSNVW